MGRIVAAAVSLAALNDVVLPVARLSCKFARWPAVPRVRSQAWNVRVAVPAKWGFGKKRTRSVSVNSKALARLTRPIGFQRVPLLDHRPSREPVTPTTAMPVKAPLSLSVKITVIVAVPNRLAVRVKVTVPVGCR